MHQFVWAGSLCGTRIGYPAAVDCSGTTQKVHVPEIDLDQGREHAWKCYGFHVLGTFDEVSGTLQSSWVRADAQC